MSAMPVVLLGHVDHGKSALFRALAGHRRQRENARGNTVDFSAARLSETLTIVDAPGHRDYRANTFAAVAGAGAFVLVVAADEGPKPQTWDHLAFARAAGLDRGLVVWTKTDRIDGEAFARRREVIPELEQFVAGDARAMSAAVREGLTIRLETLVSAVAKSVAEGGRCRLGQRGWMWVDRAFVSRAGGRVVTGTWQGDEPLCTGATLFAGADAYRARGLERDGVAVESVRPGERVALALVGEGVLGRGSRLVSHEGLRLSQRVDVRCAGRDLRAGTSWDVWLGPHGSVTAVDALRGDVARLRFPRAMPVAVGDRLVLRDGAGEHTLGYATVLEPDPLLPFRKVAAVAEDSPFDTFVARRGVVDGKTWRAFSLRKEVPALSTNEARLEEALVAAVEHLVRAERPLETRSLRAVQAVKSLSSALEAVFWDVLARRVGVGVSEGWWWSKTIETGPCAWSEAVEALLRRMVAGTLSVVTTQEREMLRWLVAVGRVVQWDDATFEPAESYREFLEAVRRAFAAGPATQSIGELRERLGLSRREAVRRFEALDRWGVTARSGDGRSFISSDRVPSPD